MKNKYAMIVLFILVSAGMLAGCTNPKGPVEVKEETETAVEDHIPTAEPLNILETESAKDSRIDFAALQEVNPEIFAWIYIPGTEIDYPILQSSTSDTFYQTHTADGTENEQGALYIEIPNMTNLCDFNTVIHGKDKNKGDLFWPLHEFEDPVYFTEHEKLYLYTLDNVYTYTIYAAYYDEGSDILRRYDYTTFDGCNQYLKDYYLKRDMTMHKREGWESLSAGHFLLTLDGTVDTGTDRQYVIMAALVDAGVAKMDRQIYDGDDLNYDLP